MICLVGTELQVNIANSQIGSNCEMPSGGTQIWAIPAQAYEQNFWFIKMPPSIGWKGFTQEQMMANVIDVTQEDSQSNWWPPFVPPTMEG